MTFQVKTKKGMGLKTNHAFFLITRDKASQAQSKKETRIYRKTYILVKKYKAPA